MIKARHHECTQPPHFSLQSISSLDINVVSILPLYCIYLSFFHRWQFTAMLSLWGRDFKSNRNQYLAWRWLHLGQVTSTYPGELTITQLGFWKLYSVIHLTCMSLYFLWTIGAAEGTKETTEGPQLRSKPSIWRNNTLMSENDISIDINVHPFLIRQRKKTTTLRTHNFRFLLKQSHNKACVP